MSATQPDSEESPFSEIQHPKKRAFLTAYAETGKKGLAAELAGIDRSAIYQPGWRDDPVFQEALARAEEMAADILEDEAFRRAVEGVEKPTGWYRGKPGGYVREYSDVLLIFQLKALRPEKYRERVEFKGLLANLDMDRLPDEAIQRISQGENILGVLASMVREGGMTQAELNKILPALPPAPKEEKAPAATESDDEQEYV